VPSDDDDLTGDVISLAWWMVLALVAAHVLGEAALITDEVTLLRLAVLPEAVVDHITEVDVASL
jgi:hypothetical protein